MTPTQRAFYAAMTCRGARGPQPVFNFVADDSVQGDGGNPTFVTAITCRASGLTATVGGTSSELYLDANGTPKERQVMKVTLSADHRVIDGAQGAQFVGGLKSLLENPVWLML